MRSGRQMPTRRAHWSGAVAMHRLHHHTCARILALPLVSELSVNLSSLALSWLLCDSWQVWPSITKAANVRAAQLAALRAAPVVDSWMTGASLKIVQVQDERVATHAAIHGMCQCSQ